MMTFSKITLPWRALKYYPTVTEMKAKAFQIHWHNKQPIYSVDFHPQNSKKLATCGGDNNIRIWNVVNLMEEANSNCSSEDKQSPEISEKVQLHVEYLATLTKHMKSVNCVRFSPSGDILASAGDGGFVILWKQSDTAPLQFNKAFIGDDDSDEDLNAEDDKDRKEFWTVAHQFRAMDGEDVYDLAWSPDGKYLILGLTDNTAQIWDTQQAKCVKVLKDHQHFIQGVAWDPLDQFLVTQSSDRSAKIWTMRTNPKGGNNYYSLAKYSKLQRTENDNINNNENNPMYSMFHDETLVSFFRRPNFSPDGSLLIIPAGQKTPLHCNNNSTNNNNNNNNNNSNSINSNNNHGIYLNLRNNLHKVPSAFIGGFEKAAIAVRFNPRLFGLIAGGEEAYVSLPYRMIFAVVTQNSVYIFDTQNKGPIFMFSNLHYASLTDVSWSADGTKLVSSSVDGFCTVANFDCKIDFGGEPLSLEESSKIIKENYDLVKGIPFFNVKPKKQPVVHPVQALQALNSNLSKNHVPMSSDVEIDVIIDDIPEDLEQENKPEVLMEIDIDSNQSNSNYNSSSNSNNFVIHNPPVKRRIAPTLLNNPNLK